MRPSRRSFLGMIGKASLFAVDPVLARAASGWPHRPITAVVSLKPGGGVDTITRVVSSLMQTSLNDATVNVINKPGASGSIAANHVWSRPDDGYNWLCCSGFNRGLRPLGLHHTVGYRDWQYFGADTSLASWSVLADSAITDMEDMIKRARDRPGGLRMSTNGPGASWHLAAVLLMQYTKTDFRVIPYKGGKPATLALLKGEVDIACSGLHEQLPFIRSGRMRNICAGTSRVLTLHGHAFQPITNTLPELHNKTPIGGGMTLALRRSTDAGLLRDIANAWISAIQSESFRQVETNLARVPDPTVGTDADRRAMLWETIAANLLHETGLARFSPGDLGLPGIDHFEDWWPPKDYTPRI